MIVFRINSNVHAIHCQYNLIHFNVIQDAIPKSLNSDFNINYTAAKYYGSIRNKDCMMKYCKKITDEKKMDIFMSCDFIEEAANLLHEKGKNTKLENDIEIKINYIRLEIKPCLYISSR